MSMHEEISNAIRGEIDALGGAVALSPTTLALAVQRRFGGNEIEPHLQYASLEHLKQMSRRELARRYDVDGEENVAHQGELFSGLLQDAYPVPDQSVYKPRLDLTDEEAEWNISILRKSANARLQHADALQAWLDTRRAGGGNRSAA